LIKRIGLLVVMLAMMAFLAAPALAQGPQGQVERGPEHARSICSFSGLNDHEEHVFPFDTQVQSYGQLVKQGFKGVFGSPGEDCNPNTGPSGPFTEDVE
jgi:hypothetical protein